MINWYHSVDDEKLLLHIQELTVNKNTLSQPVVTLLPSFFFLSLALPPHHGNTGKRNKGRKGHEGVAGAPNTLSSFSIV